MGWAYLSSQVTTLGDSLDQTDIVRMSVGTLSVTKQMQLSSSPVRGQRPGLRDLTGCLAASALGRFLVPSGLPPPAGLPHSSEVTARIQTSRLHGARPRPELPANIRRVSPMRLRSPACPEADSCAPSPPRWVRLPGHSCSRAGVSLHAPAAAAGTQRGTRPSGRRQMAGDPGEKAPALPETGELVELRVADTSDLE